MPERSIGRISFLICLKSIKKIVTVRPLGALQFGPSKEKSFYRSPVFCFKMKMFSKRVTVA